MVQVYRPLGDYDLLVLKHIAVETTVDFVLYGVQLALSIAAITILARRHGQSRFTLVAIFQFPVSIGTSERAIEGLLERLDTLLSVVTSFNFVLSDVVLIWRAWCLWPDSRIAQSLLFLCGSGSVVGGIAELAWMYWPSLHDPYTAESDDQFLRTQAETILLLLLESGIAYILFWVVDCTVFYVASGEGAIFTSISPHIAGIYPTCVLFAAAGDTTDSLLSAQVSKAMHFAGSPAAHGGARDADTTVDFHLDDSTGALNDGLQDLDSRADNFAGPSGTHRSESRFASSESIIEVERETTAM